MLSPVNGTLINPGDKVGPIQWPGDPTIFVSLTGTFANAFVILEGLAFGQSQFIPIAEVNLQSGTVVTSGPAGIGPLSNTGPGGGVSFKADAGALYQQIQLRRLDAAGGSILGVIGSSPFPGVGGPSIQPITGSVSITGQTLAADYLPAAPVSVQGLVLRSGAVMDQLREDAPTQGAQPGSALTADVDARRQREQTNWLLRCIFLAVCEGNGVESAAIEGQALMDDLQIPNN